MKRTSAGDLLSGVAALMGLDADSEELDQGLAIQMLTRASERVRQAWEREMWPFACVYSVRQFAADWAAGTTYAADAEVLGSDDVYYVSQQGGNIGNDPTGDDGTWWLSVAAHAAANDGYSFDALVAFEQAWAAEFHEASRVWDADPLAVGSRAGELEYIVTGDGIVVVGETVPAQVYLLSRVHAPRLSGRVWSAQSYAAGAVVYFSGECYEASEAVDSSKVPGTAAEWVLQEVPRDLAPFVVHAAYADMLRSDGQTERAMAEGRVAAAILADIADRILTGQQQVQRAIWKG